MAGALDWPDGARVVALSRPPGTTKPRGRSGAAASGSQRRLILRHVPHDGVNA
jgi:hypothetical protein